MPISTEERVFAYLRTLELGSTLKVEVDGEEREVILLRRGRRQIRVVDPKTDEEPLVKFTDVVME